MAIPSTRSMNLSFFFVTFIFCFIVRLMAGNAMRGEAMRSTKKLFAQRGILAYRWWDEVSLFKCLCLHFTFYRFYCAVSYFDGGPPNTFCLAYVDCGCCMCMLAFSTGGGGGRYYRRSLFLRRLSLLWYFQNMRCGCYRRLWYYFEYFKEVIRSN